jgi:hypothetical protein
MPKFIWHKRIHIPMLDHLWNCQLCFKIDVQYTENPRANIHRSRQIYNNLKSKRHWNRLSAIIKQEHYQRYIIRPIYVWLSWHVIVQKNPSVYKRWKFEHKLPRKKAITCVCDLDLGVRVMKVVRDTSSIVHVCMKHRQIMLSGSQVMARTSKKWPYLTFDLELWPWPWNEGHERGTRHSV